MSARAAPRWDKPTADNTAPEYQASATTSARARDRPNAPPAQALPSMRRCAAARCELLYYVPRAGERLKRSLAIVAGALGALWLASIGVILFYVAGLAGVPFLLGAVVCQIAVFLVASALLLVTNTHTSPPLPIDPYGDTTAGLLRNAVQLPDGLAYGRRAHDDRNVVARLSDILEEEAARRPASDKTPPWAIDLVRANEPHAEPGDVFADGQPKGDDE